MAFDPPPTATRNLDPPPVVFAMRVTKVPLVGGGCPKITVKTPNLLLHGGMRKKGAIRHTRHPWGGCTP
jgi:hypothetical protein